MPVASDKRPAEPRRLRGALVGVATAAALYSFGAAPALAFDLDGVDGLVTETIASRDRLKHYDQVKKFGGERVVDIDREYVNPDGLRLGNYVVFPSLGTLVVFDDNIYRSDLNKVADIRFEQRPRVELRSSLPRHVLDMSLEGRIVNYTDNPDQDYAGYKAKVDGALHFDHAHTISVSVLSALEFEERGELLIDLAAAEPIPVFHNRASVGITRDAGRLYGTLMGTVESWDYADVDALGPGLLEQDQRDTIEYSTALRVGYRFSPGYELVAKLRGVKTENQGDLLFDRDSIGVDLVAGLAFETNPLLRFRLLGGYGFRDYQADNVEDIATALVEGRVTWLPTQYLTFYGTVSRQIVAADAVEPGGRIETLVSARAEYEIWHNIVMHGGLEFSQADFVGAFRTDKTLKGSIGFDYHASKNWLFTIKYEHAVRESTEDAFDMTRNRFMIGAKLRF